MGKSMKRGILAVLIANIINLCFSLLSGFLLPKWLSIDTYADVKTFQLYAAYAGIFHLGYVDGIYLNYGGKSLPEIGESNIDRSLYTMRIFQLVVTVIGICIGIILKNPIIIAFGLSILPANMVAYYKNIYQAVGEFGVYSRVLNGTTISYFVLNMILIFLLRSDNPNLYISVYIIVDLFLWLILENYFKKSVNVKLHYLKFSISEFITNTKNGILLTLGNFSSILLTGMDRWFVKFLLNSVAFAQYSFAVSMEGFLNVAITPITVTMYNYFCRENDPRKIRQVRNFVVIFAAFLISCAFPVKFILEHFLQKYISSATVMFLLFAAQMFYVVIKGVYVNLYKAQKQQRKYFSKLVSVIFIGFFLNFLCYCIYKGNEAFAVGTLLSAIIWLIFCVLDHKDIVFSWNEFAFLFIELGVYLICALKLNSIMGFVIYFIVTFILSFLLLHNDMQLLFEMLIGIIWKRNKNSVDLRQEGER